jgi:hypothetical protein
MRQRLASKLLAVLGGAGLAISFCAPRAGAESPVPPWTNANYANRYICNVTSSLEAVPPAGTGIPKQSFLTGIMKLSPNGSGFFQGGTLDVPLVIYTGAAGGIPTGNATQNFCTYTLDIGSIYTVNQDGTGGETLTWDAPTTPVNAACPPSFTMTTSLVLRNNVTGNNTVPRVDMTIDNFLGVQTATLTHESGHGYCVK